MEIGALFDRNGVIVDSARPHESSRERLGSKEGKPRPADHSKVGFGRENAWIIPELLRWTDAANAAEIRRLSLREEALYRDPIVEQGIEPRPGVREPRRCLLCEDALAGLQAARAGGMKAVAVATTHPVAGLAGRADGVVVRLDELSVAELVALVGA